MKIDEEHNESSTIGLKEMLLLVQQQQMLQVWSSLSAVSLSSSGILIPNEARLCSGSVCTPSYYAPLHFQQRQLNANVPHIYKQRYEAHALNFKIGKNQQAEDPVSVGRARVFCSAATHTLQ